MGCPFRSDAIVRGEGLVTALRHDRLQERERIPGDPVVNAIGVKKHFPIKEGPMLRVTGHVRAVDGVSFEVRRGETVGLVGESGCGKTTLGRCVSGLTDPTAGGIYFRLPVELTPQVEGLLAVPESERTSQQRADLERIDRLYRIDRMTGEPWRVYRRNCQVVFQDSFSSLNPRHLVNDIVGRPLRVYREASGPALTERVVELLESVGLGRQHLYRYPHQFSGGQRQRISIARALALDPEFLVLDEPTSALDVSVQAQILNLLHVLQQERGLTYLFISHDLGVVRLMSDRIVVMYLGEVVESGRSDEIFESPQHPYTEALLAANPDLSEAAGGRMRGLEGTVPDPARPPQGCRFHTRCPVVTPACGWEVDDVVAWLVNQSQLPAGLVGVQRPSEFEAELGFEQESEAGAVAASLGSPRLPAAMGAAIEEVALNGDKVRIRLTEVERVVLEDIGGGHITSCIRVLGRA
jgi:oligopeptide/dipeptide ABC transporter ATP-binding protein